MPSDTDSYVVGQKKRRWRSRSPSYSPPRNITYLDTQDGDPYYIEEVMIKLNKKCREYSVLEADFHKYRETIGELISEKDEKTAALDGKVKNLEKTVRELVAKLAKKCKEKNVLEKEFQNFKEYSYEVISKRDEKIEKMQSIIEEQETELFKMFEEKSSLENDIESHKKESSEIIFDKNQIIVSLNAEVKVLHENILKVKEVQRKNKNASDGLSVDRDVRDVNMNIEMENVKNGNEELSIKLSKRCEEKNLKAKSLKDHNSSTQNSNKDDEETVKLSKVQKHLGSHKDNERVSEKDHDEVNLDVKMRISADLEEKFSRKDDTSIPKISFRKDIFKHESSVVPNTSKDIEQQFNIPIITTERNERCTSSMKRKYAH